MKRVCIAVLLLASVLSMTHCSKKVEPIAEQPWFDYSLDTETRIDSLIAAMTLEEKAAQMMNGAPAIERLGVPAYNWWNECLHGVARSGRATVFPQAIGLAATWDEDLMLRVSTCISDEGRAKYHEFQRKGKRGIYQGLTFWTPNINIFRDPRWGRGMETYGEDPYLTGRMAVQFVQGLQGDDPDYLKAVATVKHYAVHSGPEPDRHTFNAITNDRDLYETYLPHFRMGVMESGAYSVMCAYNRYKGEACCGSSRLLNSILRDDWGFDGYVVSDCGAIRDIFAYHEIVETPPEAAALAVISGTDLNCGGVYRQLPAAVEQGYISEEQIDVSLRRLYRARMKLGMFDPDEMVPYADIPYSVVDSPEHQQLAVETAQKSIVLLKNDNNTLPLSKDVKVAVLGPNADDVEVLLGNYNGIPSHPVTPLEGIQAKLGQENVEYALGCEWAENLPMFEPVPEKALQTPTGKPGLKVEYFDNRDFEGDPVQIDVDPDIDFNWWDGAPLDNLDDDNFAVRWTGYLVPEVSGWYYLGAEGFNGGRVYLDSRQIVAFNHTHHARKQYEMVNLKAGQHYELVVEFFERQGYATMSLLWAVPGRDYHAEAIAAAEKADVVVMCMGLSPRLEGEEMRVEVEGFQGGDRLTLDLPKIQTELMQDVVALGKKVVLVLLNGSAVSINWANDNIPAIVEAWYPGQAAGTAIADVLFGDYNPGGRLPVTFYKSVDDLPSFSEYNMVSQTYRYFTGEPLYSFGYGLSYTTFEYSDLKIAKSIKTGDKVDLSVKVKNTGEVAGEEVVQVYVADDEASVPSAVRTLKAFDRISLKPGESQTVSFTLTADDFSLLDKDFNRVVEPGQFTISVGGAQPGVDAASTMAVSEKIIAKGEIAYLE